MKKLMTIVLLLMVFCSSSQIQATQWRAWGVHGGTIDGSTAGVIDATVNDTDGQSPDYHWNKSSWDTRTGQKAFFTTNAFNGMTLQNAITSISYTVDTANSTYWGNAYWNIMVEDAGGKKAIISPAYTSATSSGFATDGSAGAGNDFCIFEAEAGWTGTSSTGWYAAEFNDVKDLIITAGPFTEYPDTSGGTAIGQDDAVYTAANWAAWADAAAGSDAGWEQDGFLFTFGQSTGTNPGRIRIYDVSVNGVAVPEPATLCVLVIGGLLGVLGKRRRA